MWLQERLRRECDRRRRDFAAVVDAQRRKKRKNKLGHEHAGLEGTSAQTESWRVIERGGVSGGLKKESKKDAKAKRARQGQQQDEAEVMLSASLRSSGGMKAFYIGKAANVEADSKTDLSDPLRVGDVRPKAKGCKGVPPLSTGAGQEFDLRLVMQQLRVDRDVALGLLNEAKHDPIEAILVYNKPKHARARLVPPRTPVKLQHAKIVKSCNDT